MISPLVTIAITTHNRFKLLCQAVNSALGQTYPNVEVVVVDDGSTDGTERLIPRFYGKKIRYVRSEHRGIAHAKNLALRSGTGGLRGILDSDDYWAPTFVERCVAELEANPEVGIVYTDDSSGPALDWSLEEFLRTRNIRGDSWLARWSVLEQTALHDERFELEVDYDLLYQLISVTQFRRIPEPLLYVRQHSGRTSARDPRRTAYWHAAGLGKYGHSIDYAFRRARQSGKLDAWWESIVTGYDFGKSLRDDLWESSVREMAARRTQYADYQLAYYAEIEAKTSAFLDIGGRTLDVGCGEGTAATFKPTITEYVGVDVLLPRPAPNLFQADAEALPFEDGSFDSVLAHSSIQHMRRPDVALAEMRRVLRTGGKLGALIALGDGNPLFMWQLTREEALALVARHFSVTGHDVFGGRHLAVNALAA